MFRSRILWRLYTGYAIIILISTLSISTLLSRQLLDSNQQDLERSLSGRAEMLAELANQWLSDPDSRSMQQLQQTIVDLGASTDSRLTIIARSGLVVADSREMPAAMDNHSQRPEILAALASGSGMTSRFSQTLQQQMMYLAIPVENGQQIVGFVRVSLPLTAIDERQQQLRSAVLISAIIVAIAALLLGFYFAKRFTDPLIKLTEAAEDISRGDYERRINLDQDDEMGELAKAFNRMARSSAERMTEITVDHNRLTNLFAGMVEGVIDVDEQQRIVHINEVAARLLDIPAAECINQPVWEYVRVIEIITALEQAIETKQVINTQMQRPAADGDTIVDIYVTALRSDSGEALGALIVLNDISELDHLETIRRDFVANASHELKTPITAIRGLTETILEDPDMDPEVQRDFIQKTHIQSLRLSSLVSDLMTISRLESDEQQQNFQPFDLGAILKSSENAMKLICQEKQLQLEVKLPEQEVIINGDFQAISQLIDNLTDNAIKYSNPNGEVSLSLEVDESSAIVRVSDSGIGISPAHQLRIFERFYRVDKARSRELGGTGLGLSIVKNIAESHGGSISLQSTPGVGSTFILQLPLAATA